MLTTMTAKEAIDLVLREKQETSFLEVKGSLSVIKSAPTEVEKDVVTLANSNPDSDGWLIFGIAKHYDVLGMVGLDQTRALTQIEKESCKQRFSQIAASTKPTAVLYDWIVQERDGKEVIAVRIKGRQKGQFYQTANGQAPFRVGDHTYFADSNKIRDWLEEPHAEEPTDPAFALAIIQIAIYLIAFSWFSVWILGQPSAWVIGFLVVSILVIGVVALGRSLKELQIVKWCKSSFPAFFTASILCVLASVGLVYTLTLYPRLSGLTFATYLTEAPAVSVYLLLVTVVGGVLVDLPQLSPNEIRRKFSWFRSHRHFLLKAGAIALLVMIVCATLAPIDSNLVLFTPKVGIAEMRYMTDGTVHIYQIGLATFGAWSQNQEIVHVMKPLFPMVSESYYSFLTNSTREPSILSATGLSVSNPTEDSQDRIVVKLTTDSTSTTDAQFSVQFYSEYDVKQLAYIYLSPRIFIRNFQNGTQQSQEKFVIMNHSDYSLNFQGIVLYSGGGAPQNQTLKFYLPQTFPYPYLYYSNDTRTFSLSGSIYKYGNLTAIVTFNSS